MEHIEFELDVEGLQMLDGDEPAELLPCGWTCSWTCSWTSFTV